MNWSGITTSPALKSSFREPTAARAKIRETPSFFKASMFARKFILWGGMVWPFPCLGRRAILLFLKVPAVTESEGLP
jgi:hypothetical protein